MGKVAIVTDSNSGITQKEAKELGIRVLPMPFYINEELFFEDITLTQEEFYQRLAEDADISTSQPSPGDVIDLWEELLKEYDEIVHIPMSSGLSSSCETAIGLARDYDGKVHVIDNQRISITQRQSVLEAIEMAEKGMSAQEIEDVLMREKLEASIYITVDTLKYLKKGGRVRRCWMQSKKTWTDGLREKRSISARRIPVLRMKPRRGRKKLKSVFQDTMFIWTVCPSACPVISAQVQGRLPV